MLVACYLLFGFYIVAQCEITLPTNQTKNKQLIHCLTGILNKYFSEQKELTYVSMGTDDEELLKAIYSTKNFSLISRSSDYQSFLPNQGYLITSKNVTIFADHFKYILTDPTWNPYARFLIIIESLQNNELHVVFDVLLRTHVNNVLVVNGTTDLHLFTYNPFDNYACGRYYNDIISLGSCLQNTQNLYPNKLVNGLKNCTFRASLAHRPPFTIDPLKFKAKKTILGTEEYIFKVLSEKEQFDVITNYSYNADIYSSVTPNMTATGPMQMLQTNEVDVIFGGMMMVVTRAQGLTYLCGYHDYNDELRFAVKRASMVPIWKTVYIEFDLKVWLILLLSFIVYFVMMVYLLKSKDKGSVALEMLENLLLHSRDFRCPMTIKYILIIWVWFAYLINTFYQSSLVSLTTNPSKEYQVSTEKDITEYKYKPCFSVALRKYLITEHTNNHTEPVIKMPEGCETTMEALLTVSKTSGLFSIIPNYVYKYNKISFNNEWGEPLIYYFDKPYTKFLFGFYFYKGFPITRGLRLNAIRLRENGLADKSLNDQYFIRTLKQRFSKKEFEVRFLLPWRLYLIGCTISSVTFVIEHLWAYRLKRRRQPSL